LQLRLSEGRLRQGVFIAALGLFFLAIVAIGIMSTAKSANEVELERTTKLAQFAVDARMKTLSAAAEANSYWDDAADAVYQGTEREAFFDTNWLPPTLDNPDYEAVMAFDANGKIWRAAKNGALDEKPLADTKLAKSSKPLMAQLSSGVDNASALYFDGKTLVVLSASNIRFTDSELNTANIAGQYQRLIYRHAVDSKAISAMGKELGISGMSFSTRRPDRPSIILRDADRQAIGYLGWNAPSSGGVAVRESLPVLVVGSLLFFLALAYSARFGFALLKRLSDQALTDSLSGLPNRRALRKAISDRIATDTSHCLALIDLDGFKNVNDRFGHVVGDRVINLVASLLQDMVRDDGIVARLGGDEFAILINCSDTSVLIDSISKRFLNRLENPIMVDGRSIWVGASIGLARSEAVSKGEGELLRRADIAMYSAKQKGKMRIEWFEAHLDDEQKFADEIASELRHSLQTGDLQVVYQPIVKADGKSGTYQCTSVEALARWTSPTHGPLGPDCFIPIAETFGLIDGIGLFVLRTACTELAKTDTIGLAVNVSAAQLRNTKFPAQLSAILKETGFAPSRLELEITETYLVADIEFARRVIGDVIALGVSVSLDDFGTGYASIGFLRQFAFGKLKIDKSLVHQGMDDAAARALVQLSVAAARAMNMVVTAEGVETQAQADLMRIVGCDQLQGWHCGHPLPFDQLSSAITGNVAKKTAAASV
jgi:diguanylate cyclase (GGDEF)-like protein